MQKVYKVSFLAVMAFALFCIFIAGFFEISDPDMFWHLKMGEDLVKHGLSPFTDHYSFTYNGAPIHGVAWPFQIVLFCFFDLFHGILGVDIFRVLARVVSVAILFIFFKKKNISLGVQSLSFIFLGIVALYAHEPRPELGTQPFGLICLLLTLKLRERWNYKTALWLSFTLFLFTNYHLSAVFGFAIAGAYLVELFIKNLRPFADQKTWIQFFITALLLIGPGFLNHDLVHPLLFQSHLAAWRPYILEFGTRHFSSQEPFLLIYWALIAFTVVHSLYRRNYFALVLIGVLSYELLQMSKLFPHFISFSLPLVALALDDAVVLNISIRGILALMTLAVSFEAFQISVIKPLLPIRVGLDEGVYPVETSDFFIRSGLQGNILNEYEQGGYLLFRLAPRGKVFIDGRTNILYPLEHMQLFDNVVAYPDLLESEIKKDSVNYVIGSLFQPDGLLETAINSGEFSMEFSGNLHGILKKNNVDFNRSSFLFVHPECLNKSELENLKADLLKAQNRMSAGSPFVSFIRNAVLFLESSDPQDLIKDPPVSFGEYHSKRLIAQMAKRQDDRQLRLRTLVNLQLYGRDDLLDMAELDCELNDCSQAERYLNAIKAPITLQWQYAKGYELLLKIQKVRPLTIFTPARIQRISSKIQNPEPRPNWCEKIVPERASKIPNK